MYHIGFPVEAQGMRAEEVTTAEVLSNAGYATAFYGKWHLGDIEQAWPHRQGFDETLFGIYNQVTSIENRKGEAANATMGLFEDMLVEDPYKLDDTFVPKGYVFTVEGKKGEPGLEWRGTTHEDYLAFDPECKKRTLEFIGRNAEAKKPFYVAYWPQDFSFIPNPKKRTVARGIYTDDMQFHVDAFVGQVMEELKRLGIAENTLLVVMADNSSADIGPGWAYAAAAPFRLFKGYVAQGGIQVPAIVKLPASMEKAATKITAPTHVMDLMPTFLEVAGQTHPDTYNGSPIAPLQGVSLIPLLIGESDAAFTQRGLGWEAYGMDAYRRRDWKVLKLPEPYGNGQWQLYNLAEDPGEVNDLSAQNPALVNELARAWEGYAEANGVIRPNQLVAYARPVSDRKH